MRRTTGRRLRRALLLAVLALGAVPAAPRARDTPRREQVGALRVVVLSMMLADTKGDGEWGFAALVEADGHRLLFDTGDRPDTVLDNARALGVDLAGVRDVVLSHHHGDHTGGLLTLRRALSMANPEALSRCHVGAGIFLSRPDDDGRETNGVVATKAEYEATGGRFVELARPTGVFPGAWLTGPVPRRRPERNWSGRTRARAAGGPVEDTAPEDTSLVLDTARGLVPVTGCGHAGVVNIIDFARESVRPSPVYALLGGIHLFPADDAALDGTAGKLREAGVAHLRGAHCTGVDAVYGLRRRLGLGRRACVVGAVGARFGRAGGIDPGTIAR